MCIFLLPILESKTYVYTSEVEIARLTFTWDKCIQKSTAPQTRKPSLASNKLIQFHNVYTVLSVCQAPYQKLGIKDKKVAAHPYRAQGLERDRFQQLKDSTEAKGRQATFPSLQGLRSEVGDKSTLGFGARAGVNQVKEKKGGAFHEDRAHSGSWDFVLILTSGAGW